jgi:hypothetical protein
MKNVLTALLFIGLTAVPFYAQKTARPKAKAPAKPAAKPAAKVLDPGKVEGRTYSNQALNFSVTFPDTWLIPDSDFEKYMKSQGFDLSLKVPPGLSPQTTSKLKQSTQRVTVLLTAYKYLPGLSENAIVRISVEDLRTFPQIKDGVDYIDAMRQTFKGLQVPGFKYSETGAEQLGTKQFAFIDTETKDDKRRLYATVKNGQALLFSITYTESDDLEVLRQLLTNGNFSLK